MESGGVECNAKELYCGVGAFGFFGCQGDSETVENGFEYGEASCWWCRWGVDGEEVVKEMDEIWELVVVCEDPAEKFGEIVKELWTAFTAEGKANCEIVAILPADAK